MILATPGFAAEPAKPKNEQLSWSAKGALTVTFEVEGTCADYTAAVLYKGGVEQTAETHSAPGCLPFSFTFPGLTESESYVVRVLVHAHVGESESQWIEKEMPGVLWRGLDSSAAWEDWAQVDDEEHCGQNASAGNLPDSRITFPADARFAKGTATHFHMNEGDRTCGGGAGSNGRTELIGGTRLPSQPNYIKAGDEGWYAFQVLFPPSYPLNSATVADGGVMQFHGYGGSGGVPFGISAGRGCESYPGVVHEGGPELGWLHSWRLTSDTGGPYERHCLSTEIHANQVYDIVLHTRFSKTSDGFLEIWLDGVNVQTYHGQFGMLANAEHSIIHAGMYPQTSRSTSPAMDLYEAGWTLATSREAAETAFKP